MNKHEHRCMECDVIIACEGDCELLPYEEGLCQACWYIICRASEEEDDAI